MRPLSASFYDKIYLESEEYRKPYHESLYYPLWKEVIKHIDTRDDQQYIVEVGCGTCQFADALKAEIFKNTGKFFINYQGIDFSEQALAIAGRKKFSNNTGQKHFLVCGDIFTFTYRPDLLIALEVLEHINDIEFFKKIHKGVTIIATVPDFPAESHLRHFTNIEAVRKRYGRFIDFSVLYKFDKWYIMKGTIK
jgi:SAM-dependent methyltransferase